MTEKQLLLVSLVIGTLAQLSNSCVKSVEPETPQSVGAIYPMSLGNRWVSKQDTYDSTGILMSSYTDTARVVGDTVIGGERWYYFTAGSHSYYTNRSDGQYSYVPAWSAQPFLDLKFPAQPGESYSIPYALGTKKVLAIDASASVPAGIYACYIYRVPFSNDWQWDYYYSPGVGMVMSLGTRRHPGGSVTQTIKVELLEAVIQ